MKLRLALCLAAISPLIFGCQTSSKGSAALDTQTPTGTASEVVGLNVLENVPVVTQIPADVVVTSDWDYDSGNEYWLYSSRGRYMTFSSEDYYAPYQNSQACAGQENNASSACSVKPSNVAQKCQHIASLTLKGIMESEPAELNTLLADYGGYLSLFGWMNDGHSDGAYATTVWQGPFIWRGSAESITATGPCPSDFTAPSGYIKWVSSVDRNGVCRTPTRGQFNALLAKARQCLEANQN